MATGSSQLITLKCYLGNCGFYCRNLLVDQAKQSNFTNMFLVLDVYIIPASVKSQFRLKLKSCFLHAEKNVYKTLCKICKILKRSAYFYTFAKLNLVWHQRINTGDQMNI